MDLIIVFGLSAVGKRTMVDELLGSASPMRLGLGILNESVVGAMGGEFVWPYGPLEDADELVACAKVHDVGILVLKHQNTYREDQLRRLAQVVTQQGGRVRLVLLCLDGPQHACRYWQKHGESKAEWSIDDKVLIELRHENWSRAAQMLGDATANLHSKLACCLRRWADTGLTVGFEVRKAVPGYPIVPADELDEAMSD